MSGRLDGKVALVIGAGSVGDTAADPNSLAGWGNGKAVSVLYAREGASVFAVDLRESAVADTANAIAREGGTCATAQADATGSDEPQNITLLGKLRFDDLESVNHVEYKGGMLFVAAGLGGLKIVKVEESQDD